MSDVDQENHVSPVDILPFTSLHFSCVCLLSTFFSSSQAPKMMNEHQMSKQDGVKAEHQRFLFGGPEGCRRNKFETTPRHTHDSRRITGDVQQRRGPAESGEVDMIKGWYVLDDHPQKLGL